MVFLEKVEGQTEGQTIEKWKVLEGVEGCMEKHGG
jgi:hypothetical protein